MGPYNIIGNWRAGWALDLHTMKSQILPDGSFETERTEVGEMLYRLKYTNDRSMLNPLAQAAADFIKTRIVYRSLSAIIPIPPSVTSRTFQPVFALAEAIGLLTDLPAPLDFLYKMHDTVPLKNIDCSKSRKRELQNSFDVLDSRYENGSVLLFDDLYRSGETLKEATSTLYDKGKLERVYVLALTHTRTKK